MSTKGTLAYGPGFHLYEEVLDEQNIYLRLDGVQFKAAPDSLTLRVPLHIWEVIRTRTLASFEWADRSDEEITQYVSAEVQDRRSRYDAARSEMQRGIIGLGGSLIYGSASDPQEEQIRRGVEFYRARRAEQTALRERIRELEETQRTR